MNTTGWIIYNGNLPGNKFLDYAEMLQAAADTYKSKTKIFKNNELISLLSSSRLDVLPKKAFPDYVVFTDKDIYLAKQLEYLGIPVFNSADSIAISDDKIATYQALARLKLPIPKTMIAPKIFIEGSFEEDVIQQAINELGFPMVIKEAFGSFGEQVYLIDNKEALYNKVNELGNRAFIFQEFIATSYGVDIRLQVVGSQVIAGMKRKSLHDFRANITAGGTMEPYEATLEEKQLAILATKAIGADFAGVDLLFGTDSPVICEVNSNAHIRNLLDCTGVNAANYIIEHILSKL